MGKMKSMLVMMMMASLLIGVSEAVMCYECGSSDFPVKCDEDLDSAAGCEGISCVTKTSDLPNGEKHVERTCGSDFERSGCTKGPNKYDIVQKRCICTTDWCTRD